MPIAATLATGIGALVAVAVLGVLAIGWGTSRTNTLALLTDKAALAVELAHAQLRDHLDPVRFQVSFVAREIERGRIDPADPAAFRTLLTGAMAATPQVLALAFWTGDRQMTGIGHVGGDPEPIAREDGGDATIAAALAQSAAIDGPYWGAPVFVEMRGVTAINLRQAVRRDGGMIGMLVAVVSVQELSRFVERLGNPATGGQAFILYGRDRVLAHSALAAGMAGLSRDRPLPGLEEIGDPWLADLPDAPVGRRIEPAAIDIRSVDVRGHREVFLTRAVDGYGPQPLILGARFPYDAIAGELRRLTWSGIAGLAVLAVAVLLGIALGRRIARPIKRLAAAAGHIGKLEFGRVAALPGSAFTELNDQARAFNTMLASLVWFETYVPRTLVKRLVAKGDRQDIPSEERELTVLFTDIAGFTAASETLPAARLAGFLNAHFALLARCVEAAGGTIDKFIGDSLMAFWNAPDDQPDHAERACRAALSMASALAADNRRRTAAGLAPVRLRIGVHSGPMVVGNIGAPGRMNYTIVGDAVNTGSRLEQLGKELSGADGDCTILISGATAARLGPDFAPQSCGEIAIRGRREGVAVYRLKVEIAEADGAGGVERSDKTR